MGMIVMPVGPPLIPPAIVPSRARGGRQTADEYTATTAILLWAQNERQPAQNEQTPLCPHVIASPGEETAKREAG